jgi:DNA-binding transcriptional MerR regulator
MRQAYAHDAVLATGDCAVVGTGCSPVRPAKRDHARNLTGMSTTYTPGQVVEKTGFSLDTLRYYEKIGLLDGVGRTSGGRRQYRDDDVGWLEMLRCLRDTGMPIARMLEFTELTRDDATIADRIDLLEEHDRDVEERIETLLRQREHIRGKIAYYRSVQHQGATQH